MKKFKYINKLLAAVAMTAFFSLSAFAMGTTNMVITYDGQSYDYSAPEISLVVNGDKVENQSMPPVILDGYTYVPVRAVFEKAGAYVNWDSDTNEAKIQYGQDMVILKINNIIADINGILIYMDTPPKIINNTAMVPVRFAAEALGFSVQWDGDENVVYIDSPTISNSAIEDYPTINEGGDGSSDFIGADKEGTDSTDSSFSSHIELARDVSPAILEMSYSETVITDISAASSGNLYTISASSEISKVHKFLLNDNRLVIDIYNAEAGTEKGEYEMNSSTVDKIWTAQNQMEPEKITRVVLQLKSAVDYTVTLSDDRKNIYIGFERNEVTDISFSSDGKADYLKITGISVPAVEVYPLTNPDRIVVDIPYTDLKSFINQAANGRFVTYAATEQVSDNLARVTLNINDVIKFSVSEEGTAAVIKIEEPSYRNIKFDANTGVITLNKGSSGLSAASIIHSDQYYNYKYRLTLPGDYSNTFGYGEYIVGSDEVYSVEIDSSSGNTNIIINENQVLVFDVTEDAGSIYIKAVSPKSKYSKIVVIDPGHGGSDPGTSGNSLIEKELTLDISKRVMALLDANSGATGIKAYATRVDDVAVNLYDRAPFANPIGDLFVSVHLNSASPNTAANGTETYYYPHANDNFIGISTKETADIFHKNIMNTLQLNDRKVKENSYVVLTQTTIPSVLLEFGFLSNEADAAKFADPDFRQQAAQAVYDSIIEVFSVYTPQR